MRRPDQAGGAARLRRRGFRDARVHIGRKRAHPPRRRDRHAETSAPASRSAIRPRECRRGRRARTSRGRDAAACRRSRGSASRPAPGPDQELALVEIVGLGDKGAEHAVAAIVEAEAEFVEQQIGRLIEQHRVIGEVHMPVIVDPLGQDLAAKAVERGGKFSGKLIGKAPSGTEFRFYKAPAGRRERRSRTSNRRDAAAGPAVPRTARRQDCVGATGLLQPAARAAAGTGPSGAACLAGDEDPDLQQQSAARRGDLGLSRPAADPGQRAPLLRHGGVRRDPRERPRRGCLRHPIDLVSGERPSDGAAGHARRAAARLGPADDRRDALLRLCPPGPQIRVAHPDLGQARRQSDHHRRRRPGADDGSAFRADPGVFRHPDRQSVSPSRCW